ncbi:MAG: LamG domain-containing protein [Candidatus Poribacteria bacterium]|nr:LamG domain-containing protein [Candidatus Poribacteria bacterium]
MGRLFYYPLFLVLMLVSIEHATADLDDDLIVHFTFDNVKGKRIFDESGNGLDARIVKKTQFVEGKYGKAIRITGETEDCVNIPSADALEISGEITMMAWVYHKNWMESTSQWFDKGCYSRVSNSLYGMGVFNREKADGSRIGIVLGGEQHMRFIVLSDMRDRTWHHIVATSDSKSVKLYLDGKIVNPPGLLPPAFQFHFKGVNDEDLRIGCAKNKPEYAFKNGSIDEVAIWSRVLSEDEIRSAMQGPLLDVTPKHKGTTTWGTIKREVF